MKTYSQDLRERVVKACDAGAHTRGELAELFGVSTAWIRRLLQRRRETGSFAARVESRNAQPPRLTDNDLLNLEELLSQGSTKHGWCNELWTCARVKQVIEKHVGIDYHPGHIYKILKKRLNWSSQKPKHQYDDRDDAEIARWIHEEFPRILQEAEARGAYIAFVDETGFMLEPTVRRTFAPRGHAPVQRIANPHARISGIGAITISPAPRRLGLLYHLLADNVNFRGPAIAQYLHLLRSTLGGPVTVVWDRIRIHFCSAVQQCLATEPDVVLDPFPSCASDLNPADGIWRYIKYARLPNYTPPDLGTLRQKVEEELRQLAEREDLLASFIHYTKLPVRL
jgi:transposase